MKVTKEQAIMASRALLNLNPVSIDVTDNCEEEQVMSDVASLVQASLAHTTNDNGDALTVSQADAHSVTSMLWSSEGILRQALLSPGLVNFSGPDEDKGNKDDVVNMKSPGTPLPSMSELTRSGNLTSTSISLSPGSANQLLAQSLGSSRSSSGQTSGGLESTLLDLHDTDTFNGALSQFPCSSAYKLSTSPELLTSHASMDPLPPISVVHKAAAGQLNVSARDQLLSSAGRSKELSSYQPSSSPLPSDMAGSLLLSSARGPLPTMSSSQVSSLLSALNADLSNSEIASKDIGSLSELEMSPSRKLVEHLGLLNSPSKLPVLQMHLSSSPHKISTLTQTDQLDELDGLIHLTPTSVSNKSCESDGKSVILTELKLVPTFARIENNSKCVSSPTFNIPLVNSELQSLPNCEEAQVVKQEKAQKSKKSKAEPKKARTRKKKPVENEKKAVAERVACFKCSFCPFLSLDKEGVDQHIETEHGDLREVTNELPEIPPQEIRCPGCPNVFFSAQSLQVHLVQDHRVCDAEVEQIVSVLCPVAPPPTPTTTEQVEASVKSERKTPRKKLLPPPDVEVYTDEQGKIRVRPVRAPVDPAPHEGACSSGGDACESSDNDVDNTEHQEEETDDSNAVKKRGRPRGSRNIGITALRRQNPTLRLGEKELGYCCALDGCAVRLRSHDKIEYHRRCHSTESGTFSCPECQHEFTQWRVLTAHLWRAHVIDMELYACDQCSFKTNSYSKLVNLHKKIHCSERPYLCDTCGKGFKTSKQLRNHKVIHNNSGKSRPLLKSGECNICLRHFADKRLLRLHKDTVHEKLKPFLCNFCGYSASSRSTLKMHLRQHTGEKPFACPECEYKTADHNSLRRHRMRHSGEKQYQCPHCTYACIQSSTYKTHLRNKHPGLDDGLLFSCPHCQFRTIKKENHVAHLAEHRENMSSQNKEPPTQPKQTINQVTPPVSKPKPTNVAINDKPPTTTNHKTKVTVKKGSTSEEQEAKKKTQPKKKQKTKHVQSTQTVSNMSTDIVKTKPNNTPEERVTNQDSGTTLSSLLLNLSSNSGAKNSQTDLLSENLQFMYAPNGNGLTTLESLLQTCPSGSDDSRYPLLASQLKLAAQLGDLGVPILTVIDSSKLLQLNASDLVPLSLSANQTSALQIALSGGEPEQITGDQSVSVLGDSMEMKFKVNDPRSS